MVNLKSITYGSGLIINGVAPDKEIILSYIRGLRDTNRFSSVMLSNMTEVAYNEWNFTLTLE